MREIILAKLGEMVLKGLNRYVFEDVLIKNIKRRVAPYGEFKVRSAQSTVYIEPKNEGCDMDGAFDAVKRVFGIVSLSRAAVCEKTMDDIKGAVLSYAVPAISGNATFKVEAKRSDKRFPLTSPEIMREAGGWVLDALPSIKVDVHNPSVTVSIEVRDFGAYVHAGKTPGAGGLPLGTGGRATVLLSGGIDSPVAGYMIAKRGVELNAVHFFSYPYTSMEAKDKVIELARLMCRYCGRMNLSVVPFTEIQQQIRKNCPDELFTLIMRRYMMKISARIAKSTGSLALVTGESIGQVASQTMQALYVTDEASDIPVLRPLIGMDKEEIVTISRKIGTFDTSILPHEDCCTVFTPKHPCTRPTLPQIMAAEGAIDADPLIERAIEGIERIKLSY